MVFRAVGAYVKTSYKKVSKHFKKIVALSLLLAFVCVLFTHISHPFSSLQVHSISQMLKHRLSPNGVTKRDVTHNVKFYKPGSKYDRPDPNRIYFHESTRRAKLNERQSCAVEAAAKHNPEKPVHLFLLKTDNFDYSNNWLKVFSKYPNIDIVLINEEEYFQGTPLEDWFKKGVWRTSAYQYIHLSDYLRMLTALKGGGLYLDIDMITLNHYNSSVRNFFVVEDHKTHLLCNSAFHLESNNRFLRKIVSRISVDYRPDLWGHHGGNLITELMEQNCGFQRHQLSIVNNCNDIQILPYYSFLPLKPEDFYAMFRVESYYPASELNQSYAVHMWNSKVRHELIDLDSDQLFGIIARNHCPLTVEEAIKCRENSNTI